MHSRPTVAGPPPAAGLPIRASLLSPVVRRAAANSFPSKGPAIGSTIDPLKGSGRTRCPPPEFNVDWGPIGREEEEEEEDETGVVSASVAESETFWSELEEEDFPTIDSMVNRAFLRPEQELAVASAAILDSFPFGSKGSVFGRQSPSDVFHLARCRNGFF